VILDLTRGRPCTPTLLAAGSVIGDRGPRQSGTHPPTRAARDRRWWSEPAGRQGRRRSRGRPRVAIVGGDGRVIGARGAW